MRAGLRVNEGRCEAAAAVINIKDWREMQPRARAPHYLYKILKTRVVPLSAR